MEDKIEKRVNDRVEMIASLQEAIVLARGSFRAWTELRDMKVDELVNTLAQNGIRFTYIGSKEGVQ